jgi:hypothetical protein
MKSEHHEEILRFAQDFGSGLRRPLIAERWPGSIVLPDGLKGERKNPQHTYLIERCCPG